MNAATIALLGVSLIVMFGYLAEYFFRKTRVPDILFLLLLGIALGPFGLGAVRPSELLAFAPIFTTFALVFLLFDGAFNIDLRSFLTGISKSLAVTLFNFIISIIVITIIMLISGYPLLISILLGAICGGISSAFVIPLLRLLRAGKQSYSVLTIESALTDVLCIVTALAIMEVIKAQVFSAQQTVMQIVSLFAVAGFIGIIAGVLWILFVVKVLKRNKAYLLTIAFVLFVYAITEFLGGNGAIAALFFGIVLANSQQLTSIFSGIVNGDKHKGYTVTGSNEEFFYSHISFFIKTFFFVYIGVLLDFSQSLTWIIGAVIAVALLFSRRMSGFLVKSFDAPDRKLVTSVFGRGLAPAAIAQLVILEGIPFGAEIVSITYSVIFFTILLSSAAVYVASRKAPEVAVNLAKAA